MLDGTFYIQVSNSRSCYEHYTASFRPCEEKMSFIFYANIGKKLIMIIIIMLILIKLNIMTDNIWMHSYITDSFEIRIMHV